MDNIFGRPRVKQGSVILHDLFMVIFAWLLAWWTRFNFDFSYSDWPRSLTLIPLLLIIQGVLFWYFRLYRGLWRFASLLDLWNIFRAAVVGALVVLLVFFVMFRLDGIPRSVLLLYPVFLIFFLGGPRLAYRLWKDKDSSFLSAIDKKKVLVIGGGRAGDMLVRDLHRSNSDMPVAILDDNLSLTGSEIHGVKIFGPVDKVKLVVEELGVDWIAIAIPSAQQSEIQTIIEKCGQADLPIKILPDIREIQSNEDLLSGLREVLIEDLLGRDPVALDWKNIQENVTSKVVLVTGGGGSIGSILCQQIIDLSPCVLIVVDNSEFNLYKIDQTLSSKPHNVKVECVLGDICDIECMEALFDQHKPQLVFHAAAYKHVPILQEQPREALKNNIQGTKLLLDVACKTQVEKFVLISTDKAVNPENVLGVSKRIAELYTESMNHKYITQCITVRFGNVLDSAGSVIPLFREQIRNGGPVTVTHPDITRYFMTINEAAQLILQAASMGRGGEIFVLDMGEPVKINYLAEQMIALSGKKPNTDIAITYCGLRPGEKLYEELFYDSEQQQVTSHEKIFLAKHVNLMGNDYSEKINTFINENINNKPSELVTRLFEFLSMLESMSEADSDSAAVITIDR